MKRSLFMKDSDRRSAWGRRRSQGWLHTLLGSAGQSGFRAGLGIAHNRYGMSDYVSTFGYNPGGAIDVSRSMDIGNLVTGVGSDTLPLLFRDKSRLGPPGFRNRPRTLRNQPSMIRR